jgi:3-methyladenine DNA glycosylase Tag
LGRPSRSRTPIPRNIPEQIDANGLNDYLEIMTKAVFQAGVSWAMVDRRWVGFKRVFKNFDPAVVASFTDADVETMMADPEILHSKNKIFATIHNAKTMLGLQEEFGSFKNYLRSKKSYEELSVDMRKRFKYVGELSVYYFLFRVKEPVPPFETWIKTIEGHHPRMREMVELAAQRKSQ